MARAALLAAGLLAAGASSLAEQKHFECSKKDNAQDCAALVALAGSAGLSGWHSKKNWLKKGSSICDWFGVKCSGGRVSELNLKANNLRGSLPATLGSLSELKVLDVAGKRPPGYGPHSCVPSGATNFNNSQMPRSFYALSKLETWSTEYTCLGGTLAPELGSMLSLQQLLLHGNFLSGTLPPELDNLANLVQHKLGRNPISGTLPPMLKPKPKLQKYNCVSPSCFRSNCLRMLKQGARAELLQALRHLPGRVYATEVPSAGAGVLGRQRFQRYAARLGGLDQHHGDHILQHQQFRGRIPCGLLWSES